VIAEQLVTNIARLVTPTGTGALRGEQMRALQIVPDAAIAIAGGRVIWCGPRREWNGSSAIEIDAAGKAVLPGLVDPHTHAVWGGERLDDFDARTSGVTYEQILARGGGIRHTVACTAAASDTELLSAAATRIQRMIRGGATTIEIKSGYGFDWAVEQRQLAVIGALRAAVPASLLATMLFHLPPVHAGKHAEYIAAAVGEWIPRIAQEQLASAIDVFIEREAFSLTDADALLAAARTAGLACKVHADQFTAMGGTELAIRHGALSVDHLEASGVAQIAALAASDTIATVLPGVTLHLGLPAAPARALFDAGAAVAIGTDCNPGSSPLFSMSLAMALAVRLNGVRAAEALIASTANAGAALGLADVGRIAPGMRADLLMLESADWRDLPYTLGDGAIARVFIGGREVTA
jgi:imidazolonepropionase